MDEYNESSFDPMRDSNEATYIDFQNETRNGPIEQLSRSAGKLASLQRLTKEWDQTGDFTDQLL